MDQLLHMFIGLLRRLAMLGLTAAIGYVLVRWLARKGGDGQT